MVFSDSVVGRVLNRLSFPKVSEGFLLLALATYFYEGGLSKIGVSSSLVLYLPAVFLVVALVLADKKRITLSKSGKILLGFYLFALISGLIAVINGASGRLIIQGWLLYLQFGIALFASSAVAKPIKFIRDTIIVALPVLAYGLYQVIANVGTSSLWLSSSESGISTRAFGFFGSPNVFGAIVAIIAITSIAYYLQVKNRAYLVVSLVATFLTVFSFSRSAWLGLILGIGVMAVVVNWRYLFITGLGVFTLLVPQVRLRIYSLLSESYWLDASLDGRLWSLNNGLHIFSKHPLLGTGPGTYGGKLALSSSSPVYLEGIQRGYVALYYTDNQWLQLLVQTGIVGLLIFAIFIAEVFKSLINSYNENKQYLTLGAIGSLVAFVVTGFMGNVLEFGAVSVLVGIIIGLTSYE